MEIEVAGERVTLDGRALVWGRTVVVADTHFGKDATARAGGAAVPEGVTSADLARLDGLLDRHEAERLWVLGDVFHSEFSREPRTMAVLEGWRSRREELAIEIVLGNHDRRVEALTDRLGMTILPIGVERGVWRLAHEPKVVKGGHVLCGHVHPGVRVSGAGRQGVRLPCFTVRKNNTILPAFGGMTGAVVGR
ncbi:MAG: ligase-associated DNA damage response endonuclease PdeM, partial [Chthoniobacterales bacterium]